MNGDGIYETENWNTYGIEIEFGTHDNYALGFTHIEVCMIHPDDTKGDMTDSSSSSSSKSNSSYNSSTSIGINNENDDCWKIETDSD
jgi:hypothetical protein